MKNFGIVSVGALLLGVGLVVGCVQKTTTDRTVSETAPGISAAALLQELDAGSGDWLLLDVRQPEELGGPLGALEGVVNIPLGTLPSRIDDIPKEKTVIVICRSGNRSSQAAAFLRTKGFKHIRNLQGGMIAVRALRK